jgi:hypothetical protein
MRQGGPAYPPYRERDIRGLHGGADHAGDVKEV